MERAHDERVSLRDVELIRYRDSRTPMLFKLVNGEELRGAVRWFDDRSIRLICENRAELTLMVGALAYYRPVDIE